MPQRLRNTMPGRFYCSHRWTTCRHTTNSWMRWAARLNKVVCAEVSRSHSSRRGQVTSARPSSRHRSAPRCRSVRPRIHPVVRLSVPGLHSWPGLPGVRRWPVSSGRVPEADRQSRFVLGYITCPLARLQMGRAKKLMGDNASASESYEEFLNIWKDADPDLPIYRQAKAEYAQLQNHSNQTR